MTRILLEFFLVFRNNRFCKIEVEISLKLIAQLSTLVIFYLDLDIRIVLWTLQMPIFDILQRMLNFINRYIKKLFFKMLQFKRTVAFTREKVSLQKRRSIFFTIFLYFLSFLRHNLYHVVLLVIKKLASGRNADLSRGEF